MLSICIPVFNYDVRALVNDLHEQAAIWPGGFEIWVMDDESRQNFRKQNRDVEKLEKVVYVELKENQGRSKVRNKLAQKARGDYILFLDCDVLLPGEGFLARYLDALKKGPKVLCGGHIYQKEPPGNNHYLHWYYGIYRETVVIDHRTGNHSFMSGNFLTQKDVFEWVHFDENIRGYGHEDTLFGLELAKQGIEVGRIDNPVIHMGLDSNQAFMGKTRESVEGLLRIYQDADTGLLRNVKLLKTFLFLKKVGLCRLMRILFKTSRRFLESNLTGTAPRLVFLDLYKLGYMCELHKKKR